MYYRALDVGVTGEELSSQYASKVRSVKEWPEWMRGRSMRNDIK